MNERKAIVEWDNIDPHLTIKAQAQLLLVNRTSLYRTAKEVSEQEVQIKHLIDKIHTEKPFKGSRTIKDDINEMNLGFKVNRKRIQRYMREMGIRVIYPGPNLSKRNRAQYVYPYLLRNVKPAHPNHVWGIDITYVAMQGRWMYLVAIIDWYSRAIVGHELSHTMNKEFVIKAVNNAVKKHGAPIIKSFAKVAPIYGLWSRFTESKAAKRALELAQIKDGEKLLEVAVGTGIVFAEIVKQNKNGENVGVDLSPSMLARAREMLKNYDMNCFDLQLANAYHLPFDDHSFDLVVNNYMLDLVPEGDLGVILAEFHRVLKPSGRVIISNMAYGEKWYNRIWYWLARNVPSLLTGCRPIVLHDYLAKVGFGNIYSEKLSQNFSCGSN